MPKKPDKTVRCVYCGREIIKPIPHICNKNYRKRNLKWINLMEDKRKQFNVEEFISNEETPVETRDGVKVEIFSTTRKSCDYVVVGDILREDDVVNGDPKTWTQKGKYILNGEDDHYDLFFSIKKKTRVMTHKELSRWLKACPEEYRECKYSANCIVYSTFSYLEKDANKIVEGYVIRSNESEWKEPLIEE